MIYNKGFIKALIAFLFCNPLVAGIMFDLSDPKTSKIFKEAVDNTNKSLSSEIVSSMGAAPVNACIVTPAEETPSQKAVVILKPPAATPTVTSVPVPPETLKEDPLKGSKGKVKVDTFKVIEEKSFTCSSAEKVEMKGADGKNIKSVCPELLNQLAISGIAKLDDGSVVQMSKAVKVEKIINGEKKLFWEKRFALANPTCAYGQTGAGICLEPYRSLIVSNHLGLKVGDIVYLDEFKDVVIPPGIKHGGYFIVSATKKTDENLKPEISVFLGVDSSDQSPLHQAANIYQQSGFRLNALQGQEKAKAEDYIRAARKQSVPANPSPIANTPSTPSPVTPPVVIAPKVDVPQPAIDEEKVNAEFEKLNKDGWSDIYTQTIMDSIGDSSALMTLETDEIKAMCPRFTDMNPNDKKIFWAHFFRSLAEVESGFGTNVGYIESGEDHADGDEALKRASGKKTTSTSNGLLQLSYQDALYHGCDFDYAREHASARTVVAARKKAGGGRSLNLMQLADEGHLTPEEYVIATNLSIYDPVKNLECGMRIFEKQIGPEKRSIIDWKGKYYWSVLSPKKNKDGYDKFMVALQTSNEICSKGYAPAYVAAAPITTPAPNPAVSTIPTIPPYQGTIDGDFHFNLSDSEKNNIAQLIANNNSASVSPSKVDEIAKRLDRSAKSIVNFHHDPSYDGAPVQNGEELSRQMQLLMDDLGQSQRGRYALLDYLEFKGEGLSPNERVYDTKGKKTSTGFGLYQVLASAASEYDGTQDTADLFAKHAQKVLDNRIALSDSSPNDKKGISAFRGEWNDRTSTYTSNSFVAVEEVPQAPAPVASVNSPVPVPAPATLPSEPVVAEPVAPNAPITAVTTLDPGDQPFANEAKLFWEGNFPDIDCANWNLNSENFCFPEPGRIVLSPSHSEDSQRNEINENGVGEFLHEGRMNMSTSLIIKNAVEKCLAKNNNEGSKVPLVKLARWPGESEFGVQEFGSAKAGTIQDNSNSGDRKGYINQYLFGDGSKMDKDIAANSLMINIDYNTTCNGSKRDCPEEKNTFYSRDGTEVFVPSEVRTGVTDTKIAESREIGSSIQDATYSLMRDYLNSLGAQNPVSDMNSFESKSKMKKETSTGVKRLGMFTVGDSSGTRVLTVEGFYMNGEIGKAVAVKYMSGIPENYNEFQMRKVKYDSNEKKWIPGDLVEPIYRVTQEQLIVARGVVQGIMNNEDYQCK